MKRYLPWLVFFQIYLLFSLGSCEPDVHTREINVGLQFFSPRVYQRVYGLGGKGDLKNINQESEYTLPIDFNRDTTVYIFERNPQEKDTLTLVYQRIINPYENRGCSKNAGFSVNIEGLRMVPQLSTFTQNEFNVRTIIE